MIFLIHCDLYIKLYKNDFFLAVHMMRLLWISLLPSTVGKFRREKEKCRKKAGRMHLCRCIEVTTSSSNYLEVNELLCAHETTNN